MTDESSEPGKAESELSNSPIGESADSQVEPTPQEALPKSEPASLDRRRAALVDVWLVIAVYFLPFTYSAIENWFYPRTPVPLAWTESALTITATGYAALGIYLITRSGTPPAAFGLVRFRGSDLLFGGLLCGLMFVVVGVCIYLTPSNLFGVQAREVKQLWGSPQTVTEFALVALAACLNGFSEEVMVRAYFQTRLEHLTKAPVWSVIVTSALFSGYHAYYGPSGMVYVFAIGLLFGIYFRLTRRLWAVAIAHGGYDILVILQHEA